jgi:hypothetical protein
MSTTYPAPQEGTTAPATRSNGWGVSSLVLGLLGLLFFWLVPLGVIFSGVGIPVGIIGWAAARRGIRTGLALAIGGTILCILVFAFDIDMASGGLTRLFTTRY